MSALGELQRLGTSKGGPPPRKRDNKAAFLFLLPWFAGLLLITAGPIVASLGLSFTDYNLIQPPEFNGVENISRMFGDERLHRSLGVTFIYVFVSVPLQLLAALGLAILLDRGLRGLPFYRSAFYCRRCSAPASRSRCCGSRSSVRRDCSTRCSASSASPAGGGSPTRTPRCRR